MSEGRPLIGSPPSRPGKACFHFPACCTSQRHDASCAKPHPTNKCPYRWLLILFLFLANGSVGQNFHLGTKLRISEHQNFSLSTARGAGQQLCRTFPGGTCTDPPSLQPPGAGLVLLPARGQPPCHPVPGGSCRHRLHPPSHLPGFKARQVGLEDLGD